jgi:hypothetical protein
MRMLSVTALLTSPCISSSLHGRHFSLLLWSKHSRKEVNAETSVSSLQTLVTRRLTNALIVVGDGNQGATVTDVLEQLLHLRRNCDGVHGLQLPRLQSSKGSVKI